MDVVRVSKALSDPLRFQILKKIAHNSRESSFNSKDADCCAGMCVCHLVEGMGLLQSKISYHIKELKEAGLITEETRGRWNYYSLNAGTLEKFFAALDRELQG